MDRQPSLEKKLLKFKDSEDATVVRRVETPYIMAVHLSALVTTNLLLLFLLGEENEEDAGILITTSALLTGSITNLIMSPRSRLVVRVEPVDSVDTKEPEQACSEEEEEEEDTPEEVIEPDNVEIIEIIESIGDSVSGVYVAEDEHGSKFIFKPEHEEAMDPEGMPLKRGVTWGDCAKKEIAAYVLDRELVPETRWGVVHGMEGGRQGSIQRFIAHEGSCDDYGSGVFSTQAVQRVALLDLRLLNLDRHPGNLLVVGAVVGAGPATTAKQLVPIDHGYCLPSFRDASDVFLGWQFWPQAKAPVCEAVRQQLLAMDVRRQGKELQQLGIDREAVLASVLASELTRREVLAKGSTLAGVARMVGGSMDDSQPSVLSRVFTEMTPELELAVAAPTLADDEAYTTLLASFFSRVDLHTAIA